MTKDVALACRGQQNGKQHAGKRYLAPCTELIILYRKDCFDINYFFVFLTKKKELYFNHE